MSQRYVRGFTLLEWTLVSALTALFLLVSLPALKVFLTRSELYAVESALIRVLELARSQAVLHQSVVEVCASGSGLSCGWDWSMGWLVRNEMGQVLQYERNPSNSIALFWRGSFGRNHHLNFTQSGFTLGQQGRFYFCPKSAADAQLSRALVVNSSGRLRMEQGAEIAETCAQTENRGD